MATIKEIADKLGIAVSTVSKGLNGAPDISENLRQLVLDTAVEMGYKTKRMRRDDFRKLVVFVENMEYLTESDFGYDLVLGFTQMAFRDKWKVNVIPISQSFQKIVKYNTYMLKEGYSGAFIMGMALQDKWMEELEKTTIPTALLDNHIDHNPHVGYVGTDSFEGMSLAIKALAGKGHTKVAFLNGSSNSFVSDQREEAFKKAMTDNQLPIDEELIVHGYYVAESAPFHVPGMLKAGATAIVCGNDLIASGVIKECQNLSYRVPEDVSVIGFDDIPLASTLSPALTTIRQERLELGRLAYFTLNSLMNNVSVSKTLLRPSFIERESIAPYKAPNKKKK